MEIDYFMLNLYFFTTWVLITVGIIAIIIKLPTEDSTKSKTNKYNIHSVKKHFDDKKFINNVICSYRHDFGLLDKQEQDKLRFECKEWLRAISNNLPK